MKTIPTALAAHIASRQTTLATALKITRKDGTVYGFTTHDVDDTVAGVTYSSNPGLTGTDIVIAANLAVGNLELTTLHDGTTFTTADILGGKWRNAAFTIFRYNWASPTDGIETLLSGTLGECQILQNTVVAELRDLRQYLQQAVGSASSKTCRVRLGSVGVGKCNKDLTEFTVIGAVTAATSNQVFRDSSRTEALAWFDEGDFTFTSGANVGSHAKVKAYAADGTYTLALPMMSAVEIGDAYVAVAGCRKRLAEDCRDKFDNVLNFVAEPHRKGLNDVLKSVVPNV